MIMFISYLMLAPLFPRIIFAQKDCSFQPVELPLKWVTLPNNGSIRGAPISVGSPAQNFSLLPVVNTQSTYFYQQSKECDITEAACMTRRGGFFLPHASETYKAREAFIDELVAHSDGGRDTLILNQNISVQQFPVGVMSNPYDIDTLKIAGHTNGSVTAIRQAAFGLGRNSTILTALKRAGNIGSKSFGYWWGLDGATDSGKMDGSLVLGGYDRAKIKNPEKNYTGNFLTTDHGSTDQCVQGMTITINEIRVNFPNGSAPNLLILPKLWCICMHVTHLISLPDATYYKHFQQWTNATYINRSTGLNAGTPMFRAEEAYQGDVTVVLGSGLAIRVPNSQLSAPDLTIGEDGKIKANTSVRDMMLSSQPKNNTDLPCLGRVFFTAAYMHVDNDRETFTIWEANATTEKDLISVTDAEVQAACPASTTTLPRPQSTSDGKNSAPTKPNAGLISGMIIFALALLGAIGGLLYREKRRSLTKATRRAKEKNVSQGNSDSTWVKGELEDTMRLPILELPGAAPPEMVGDPLPPQELWAGRRMSKPNVHELPG